MVNIINKLFYNKEIKKKTWNIKGVETDPKQNEEDDNIKIENTDIKLTLSQEKGNKSIVATIQVKNSEYSFILYDEILDYIRRVGGFNKWLER